MLSFNKPHAGRPAVGLVDTGVPGATGTGGNCGVGVGFLDSDNDFYHIFHCSAFQLQI